MLASHLRHLLLSSAPPISFSAPYRHRRRLSSMSSSVPVTASGDRSGSKSRLRGVVFDMDGTLTVPAIDFAAMYRAVLGEQAYASLRASSIDILHHIETWGPQEQQKAYETIARFERDGLDRLQIMPGAAELCRYLDSRKIKRGLITRNVKDAVDLFHQRFGMEFYPALSREFRPYKPDPAPLLHICTTWDIPPSEVLMIGDSLKDDVVCGKRAGAFTCLLDETGRYGPIDTMTDDTRPEFMVSSLAEVHALLETRFDLLPHVQETDERVSYTKHSRDQDVH